MKLNRTGNALNRETRNNDNDNWAKLEKKYNNVVGEITEEVFDKIVDGSKIDWSQMVDTVAGLPSDAEIGETRGVKEDNKIYRFDGSNWIAIAEINLNPIAEVDERLSEQISNTNRQAEGYSLDIGLTNKKNPRSMFTLIDDDGNAGVYTKLYPIFKSRGLPFTAAIITSEIDNSGFLTTDQLKEMYKSGVEIISHSHYHNNLTNYDNDEELRNDLTLSKQYLFENGFNYRAIAYPYNKYDNRVDRIARELFDYGFAGVGDGRADYMIPPINMFRLRRYDLTLETLDSAKQKALDAHNKNEWIVFYMHVDQDGISTQFVEELIDYAHELGMEFVTTEEGVRHHGNWLELDRYSNLDKFGRGWGKDLQFTHIPRLGEHSANDPITSYPEGISLTRFRTSEAVDLPSGAGTIITIRPDEADQVWNRQIYYSINDDLYMTRFPDGSGWSSWNLMNPYMTKLNEYTDSHKPSDFHIGITHTRIQTSHAEGLPFGKGGTLKTVKLSNTMGWSYQEYKEFGGGAYAKRHALSNDDGWTDWILDGELQAQPNFTDGDMQPEDFPAGTITNIVRSGTDLPYTSGILKTIKTTGSTEDFWSIQEFYAVNHQTKFIRFANQAGGWHAWKELT